MELHSEILRYMGHNGPPNAQLEGLILGCLEKLIPACAPRHLILPLPCVVEGDSVAIDSLSIRSAALAANLDGSSQAFLFAATLGVDVDRLITQRAKMDSAETLCLQACASAMIEDYCDGVMELLSHEANQQGLYLRPRFSPGCDDFDIKHQRDILNMLDARKRVGLYETKAHLLTPLKSLTAIIGAGPVKKNFALHKCSCCNKTDCLHGIKEV